VLATVDVQAKRSNRLKFTPDGKLVLISDVYGGEVIVVDAQTRRVVARISVGRGPEGILIQPDGKNAFVALGEENKIVVLDVASPKVASSFTPGSGPDGMAWAMKK